MLNTKRYWLERGVALESMFQDLVTSVSPGVMVFLSLWPLYRRIRTITGYPQ